MPNDSRAVRWLVWSGLALVIMAITLAFIREQRAPHPSPTTLPVLWPVRNFTLTNQNGQSFSLANLYGSVWVGEIIFTRCPGPCPRMTANLAALQAVLPADRPIKLVTLTSDPLHDTVPVLKRYGERFGAKFDNWHFLTGDKSEIRRLAVEGLKLIAEDKPADKQENADDLFIHSTTLVVVDKGGRVRASFDGAEATNRTQILEVINQLDRELPLDPPVLWPVTQFHLTNQAGQPVTLENLHGNVWVGEIIFTRCPGPCPRMTANLAALQGALPANQPVKLVTLTSDPLHDTGPVLKRYGERFGAKFDNWHFLTGDKSEIRRLAVEGLKLITEDKPQDKQENPDDLFIHSTTLVVVDKAGRARGAFDGAEAGVRAQILALIERLSREN